ncbi:LysR family transcriptional regulator [Verminephrobacter aporrectodeae subsp. tuberculatae]|uniref:LysR family transcriptional regulator n=2 Tax=Verminephrobacter TaxID=364316 RepID=A0ABT3KTM5_9BURK|nr:LysR family transcriptional regulator [Verminephrobacter aporrectodeae]MCW5257137.1 LysR family transcriptional regulator [Verminephrobacter aporrectodeae subsp. tuberculatae]MCW5321663.1 LysR family transcriptional regulator [Verminephrobacter aporrectodeae subsp. tuberculatae]MCW8164279.1 LysR family transcriptional regulator [Verminephrobacter aporrectodeae subsp. tuberculatae]MCW8171439.1 LysR family transcriptional regulator [Verminephrobacter aporrectodeae subsp. tuberculatae]MCW81970
MPLSMRDIEYFLAVAKTGLLSVAADQQGVTQSALTKAVRRVESEFGLPLFERSARGMALTSAGQRMVEQAFRLQAEYADTVLLANEMRARQSGLLRVGVTDTTAGNRIAAALGALLAQRPGLRVRLRVDRSDTLAALLHEGALDLALVPAYEGQPLDAERTKIDNDPMLPVVRSAHPLVQQAQPGLADVAAYGWITGAANSAVCMALTKVLARHGLAPPRVVMEVSFASDFNLAVLAATDLVTLVPRSFMQHVESRQFRVLPIAALCVPRAVVLLSRPGSNWSPLMQALRDGLLARAHGATT